MPATQIVSVTPVNIIRGPCWIEFNGTAATTMYSEGDVIIDFEYDWEEIKVSAFGPVDRRLRDRKASIKFTPQEVKAGAIPGLWPWAGAVSCGTSATGVGLGGTPGTPNTVKILPQNGTETGMTFANVIVTKMPDLHFANGKNWFGPLELTAIGNPALIWSNAASFAGSATAAAADTSFLSSSVLRQGWTGIYTPVPGVGDTPGAAIDTDENGFTIRSSGLVLEPVKTNNFGTVDYTFGGLSVEVEFTPAGISAADIWTMMLGLLQGTQSSGVVSAPGVSAAAYAAATAGGAGGILTLTGSLSTSSSSNTIVINGLVPEPQMRYGSTAWRAGPIKLKSNRMFGAANVGSAAQPLAVFTLS